jgi:hypothetical protein
MGGVPKQTDGTCFSILKHGKTKADGKTQSMHYTRSKILGTNEITSYIENFST